MRKPHPYKRHTPPCTAKSQTYTRCNCGVYARGVLVHPVTGETEHIDRVALHTTDINVGAQIVANWVKNGTTKTIEDRTTRTVEEAVAAFLKPRLKLGLVDATHEMYVLILQKRLVPFCERRNQRYLTDITIETLEDFRDEWPGDLGARANTQRRLQKFFKWCAQRKYILDNPAVLLERIKVHHKQKLPFTVAEMDRILAACDRYPTRNNTKGISNRAVMKAFVLTMRWAGLRIGDAVSLRYSEISDKGIINRITLKRGIPIQFPIHPDALSAIRAIRREGNDFVFWGPRRSPFSKNGKLRIGATSCWQKKLNILFDLALGKDNTGTSHRFRHMFAVEYLLSGLPIQQVSKMLGHENLQTTIQSYNAWVKTRQDQLEQMVTQLWPMMPSSAPVGSASVPQSPLTASLETVPGAPGQVGLPVETLHQPLIVESATPVQIS